MKILGLLLIFGLCLTGAVYAGNGIDGEDTFTLPDGRVLQHPYIMEKSPDGITIGYDEGCIFVRFKDMSPELQKKFNYDPAAAAKYSAQVAALDAQFKQQQAARAAEFAQAQARVDKFQRQEGIEEQKIRIQRLQMEIDNIKADLPKLEKFAEDNHQSSISIAEHPAMAGMGQMFGAFSPSSDVTGQQEVGDQNHEMAQLDDQAKDAIFKYRNLRASLDDKEIQLEREQLALQQMLKATNGN